MDFNDFIEDDAHFQQRVLTALSAATINTTTNNAVTSLSNHSMGTSQFARMISPRQINIDELYEAFKSKRDFKLLFSRIHYLEEENEELKSRLERIEQLLNIKVEIKKESD